MIMIRFINNQIWLSKLKIRIQLKQKMVNWLRKERMLRMDQKKMKQQPLNPSKNSFWTQTVSYWILIRKSRTFLKVSKIRKFLAFLKVRFLNIERKILNSRKYCKEKLILNNKLKRKISTPQNSKKVPITQKNF